MKKVFLLFTCLVSSFFARAQEAPTETNLTDAQKAFILSKFCTEVKYNYVFYNDLTFDWDSLCMTSLPLLLETKTDIEFGQELKRLSTRLNDGHTTVYPARPANNLDWIKPLPLKTKRIGDQVFVKEVLSSELKQKGIEIGTEILEVNGMKVMDYADKHIKPYTSSSTPQWLEYAPYREFELTKDKASNIIKLLLKDKKGKTFTYESTRNIPWDLNSPAMEFEILGGNIGLLRINSFMGNNFVGQFDEIYNRILTTDGLIIDIRDNSGGNSGLADYVLRHLSDKPIKTSRWSSRMYIATHASWGYSQEWYMESPHPLWPLDKEKYLKPVALLVNASTFSSAENFCVLFRGMNRGKIIGTATGGSTGNPINIDLGYGYEAQICTRNEWDIEGNKFIGVGIIPDVKVEETNQVYLKGKDVVVEQAMKHLK